MPTKILLFLLAIPSFGAITNLRQTGATPKEIIVQFVSPITTACVPEVSESATYSPLVHDVDPTLFTGSNSDFRNGAQGRERTLIVGSAGLGIEYAPVALSGIRVSRALRTDTPHYIRITCGSDVATLVARTANIAPGDTRPRTTGPIDPAYPGVTAWPDISQTSTSAPVIDPVSGVSLQRMFVINSLQGPSAANAKVALDYIYDDAGTWTNVGNLSPVLTTHSNEVGTPVASHVHVTFGATLYSVTSVVEQAGGAVYTRSFSAPNTGEYFLLGGGDFQFNAADTGTKLFTYVTASNANDGAVASFTGSSNDPIKVLYAGTDNSYGPVTGLTLYVRGHVDNVTTTTEACVTFNGSSCYGKWVAFTLPVGTDAQVAVGDPNIWATSVSTPSMLAAWLNTGQEYPITNFGTRTGFATNIGSNLKATYVTGGSASFGVDWGSGTHLIYNGVDYKGPSIITGTELTLPSSPANATNAVWTARTFGFLVRKSSVGGTVSIDDITFTTSFYQTQVPNGGSGGSKQCTTSQYHSGWRIGGPQGVNTNAATNTSPIVIHTTQDPTDLANGDVVKVRDVPVNTAANGTWTIANINHGAHTFELVGSTGNGTFPSDVGDGVYYGGGGLVWKLTSPTGHLCYTVNSQGDNALYWIDPDVYPIDIRYQGPGKIVFQGQAVSDAGKFAEDDPEVPKLYKVYTNGSGKQELLKGTYTGSIAGGMFQTLGPNVNLDSQDSIAVWNLTSLTPAPSTLTDRFQAFDPTIGSFPLGLVRAPKPNILAFSGFLSKQNSLGWLAVYDVTANAVVGMMNSWSSPNTRYCGIHTPLAWEGADYYVYQTYEQNGVDGSDGPTPYKGPYRMTKTSGAISATPTDCATQFTALSLTNTLAVTGSHCTTITVGSTTPITPASANPPSDTLGGQTLQLGDLLRFYDGVNGGGDATYGNPNTDYEIFRVIGISGLSVILQRDMTGTALGGHVTGGYMHEFCDAIDRGWDYTNAPHGFTGTDPYSQNLNGVILDTALSLGSHTFTRNGLTVVDTNGGAGLVPAFTCPSYGLFSNIYTTRNYPWPNHFSAPTSAYGCVAGNPDFDGSFGNGSGNFGEKHPSPVENLTANPSWFDSRPFEISTQMEETVTKVGTYVYKVTGFDGGVLSFDEKRHVLFVRSGFKTIKDISGPSAMLSDTTGHWYEYCLVHVAGECWSGSSVGEVYMNAPFVSKVPNGWTHNDDQYRCTESSVSWSLAPDICVQLQPAYTNTTTQSSADNDPFNTGVRKLSSSLHLMASFGHIETNPALPDGTVTINQSVWNEGFTIHMAKIPPYPGKQPGVNRRTWIPIAVKISSVPAGTSTAMIRFGYNTSMQCTTRLDVCIANGAGIQTGANVFKWEVSDSPTGLACSSGCTITIPAFSQRVMWSQIVYRNSGGTIIKTGPVEVMATP